MNINLVHSSSYINSIKWPVLFHCVVVVARTLFRKKGGVCHKPKLKVGVNSWNFLIPSLVLSAM